MSDKLYNIFYQSHAGSWAILVLLFVIAFFLFKNGARKGGRIVHMVLRLFYIIMLVSGGGMVVGLMMASGFPVMYVIKGVLAVMLIGLMEMILGRTSRSERSGMFWIMMLVFLVLIVLMGFGVIQF